MKNSSTTFFRISCLLLIFGVLASCKNERLIQRGDTLPVAYKKAMALFQSGEFGDAAQAFETVISIGRGTDYGQSAQYLLAQSYFNDERFLLAASEYKRYITLFPRAEKRDEAQYKEALSYFKLSPRYKLDQEYTHTAIEKFRLYISRYPESVKVEEAASYINKLRAKLAKKMYFAADLYRRIDSYEAAIIYYDLTIERFPGTVWAQRALLHEIETYIAYADHSVLSKQPERYGEAIEAYEKFIQLFPNGKYRDEAEEYVDEARSALAALDIPEEEAAADTADAEK
ncbi:MAG TPA: outer membrane protein assembly factor BamD [Balneolaceae bacterium]|nr:outer membrane protein assembly factor BamD [Balneolaceae bacterium]